MANERTAGGPLTATVGEQLAGKGHLDAARAAGEEAAGGAPGAEAGAGEARRRRGRGPPWGAILAAGAGWILAKSIARALRRPARRARRRLRWR